MGVARSYVDDQRYIFTTDVEHASGRTSVAVHWTGIAFEPEESFLDSLRKFLAGRNRTGEVWLLYPEDLEASVDELRVAERFPKTDENGIPTTYRFFRVGRDGTFDEPHPALGVKIDDAAMGRVVQDGLRQLFHDSEALACAPVGYHFTHPGGSHSQYFIRGSQAAARAQHAYFLAAVLLRSIDPATPLRTLWVDTAGIAPVGYAFIDLARRLAREAPKQVESFGGHDSVETQLSSATHDVVLVSGSTSGTLSARIREEKNLPHNRVITLFFLNQNDWDTDRGALLCDLTRRHGVPSGRLEDSHIAPYPTYRAREGCALCEKGSGELRLTGDAFFPETGALILRMPSLYDRPFNNKRLRDVSLLTKFDGSGYFADLFGSGAITHDPRTVRDGSARGISTRLVGLFDAATRDAPGRAVASAVVEATAEVPAVSTVLALPDEDSAALGAFVAEKVFNGAPSQRLTGQDWYSWTAGMAEGHHEIVPNSTVLVCAGVIASGRALTDLHRQLRAIETPFHIRYLVGAAHPESSIAWTNLNNTLRRVSSDETSEIYCVWHLPREPRAQRSGTPWVREATVLEHVAEWLKEHPELEVLRNALEPRLLQLLSPADNELFVAAAAPCANEPIAPLNRNFALWPFEWSEERVAIEDGARPSHAEIFATVSHLLYESRRLNPLIDGKTIAVRRYGYALDPAIFDRYNDPVIQAATLRATAPGELHYGSSLDATRAVVHLLWFVLTNVERESGGAAYEFLLALCEGTDPRQGYGLRIDDVELHRLLDDLETVHDVGYESLTSVAPHVRALLLYLRAKSSSDSTPGWI